jgi:hypothetical protein
MLNNPIKNTRKAFRRLKPCAIVCHELKLIYYSIPKVASSSMKSYMLIHGYSKQEKIPETLNQAYIHSFDYPKVTKSEVSRLRRDGYVTFTIVRNPYDRIISCYNDKIVKPRGKKPLHAGLARYNSLLRRRIFDLEMSWDEFLNAIKHIPDIISDGHFRSQARFIPSICDLDQIFKIEEINESMPNFLASRNLPGWLEKRQNPTAKSICINSLEPQHIKIINKRYRRDFMLLDYLMLKP